MRQKKIKVKAYCPYEIGDKVQFEKGGSVKTMVVTDVITETSAKKRYKQVSVRVGRLVYVRYQFARNQNTEIAERLGGKCPTRAQERKWHNGI